MESINFTAYTEDASQIEAVKAFMKALKIKFEVSEDLPYKSDFVAKIEKSKQQALEGKVTRVETENLKEFLGL